MAKLPIMLGDYLYRFGPVLRRFRDMQDDSHAEVVVLGDPVEVTSESLLATLENIEECVCALANGRRASGSITLVNPADLTECDGYGGGDGFTISDGTLTLTFEFGAAGCVGAGSIAVSAAGDPLQNLADAINASALDITAVVVGGVLHLENNQFGEIGNVLMLYFEHVNGTYLVVGMAGGLNALLWAATPGNQVVTLTLADTEYAVVIPSSLGYEFRARTNVALRYAFAAGRVAGPTDPYLTLQAGEQYHAQNPLSPHTLYLATADAGTVVELLIHAIAV